MTTVTAPHLTRQQQALLELVAQGFSHAAIGDYTGRTEDAVTVAVGRLRRAFDARNNPHMIFLAARAGLLNYPVAGPYGHRTEVVAALRLPPEHRHRRVETVRPRGGVL